MNKKLERHPAEGRLSELLPAKPGPLPPKAVAPRQEAIAWGPGALALALLVAIASSPLAAQTGRLTFKNNCSFPIWLQLENNIDTPGVPVLPKRPADGAAILPLDAGEGPVTVVIPDVGWPAASFRNSAATRRPATTAGAAKRCPPAPPAAASRQPPPSSTSTTPISPPTGTPGTTSAWSTATTSAHASRRAA
jgi:hypothetical protein